MMQKHLLITGFDPFGVETVNPSWEAVRRLPDEIDDLRLTRLQIPTVYRTASERVLEAVQADPADFIICVGQAGGRSAVTPERIGVNFQDCTGPDNRGNMPTREPCIPGGPDGIFSTLPVDAMARAVRMAGLPSYVSLSAGSFVCNDTLYRLLHHFAGTETKVGFIHLPYLPQQAKDDIPSMELSDMIRALMACISVL